MANECVEIEESLESGSIRIHKTLAQVDQAEASLAYWFTNRPGRFEYVGEYEAG
jgi:hypothetical protein